MCLCDGLESVGGPDTTGGSPCWPLWPTGGPGSLCGGLETQPRGVCVQVGRALWRRTGPNRSVRAPRVGSEYHLLLEKARKFSRLMVSKNGQQLLKEGGNPARLCLASGQGEITCHEGKQRKSTHGHSPARTRERVCLRLESKETPAWAQSPTDTPTDPRGLQPAGWGG